MKTRLWLCGWFLLAGGFALAQPKPGDIVFQTGFEGAAALRGWESAPQGAVRLAAGFQGTQALEVETPAPETRPSRAVIPLPLEVMRGARIFCEAMVKAEGVTPPPKPWNGVKFMLHVKGPGGDQWVQQRAVSGTFDWKHVSFKAEVPADATAADLFLGLELVSGRVWFDDVKLSVLRGPRARPAVPPTGPAYTGHVELRLRGAMISPGVTAADLETLGKEWGANHVRWQLVWSGFPHSPADNGDLAAYDAWLEGALKHLDGLLPVCERLGIKVLIDLHTPPGGRDGASVCRLFQEKRFQESFLAWWEKIATRYRGSKAVWGYDLLNEPIEGTVGRDCMDWQQLVTAAARGVRRRDPEHAIIVEPEPGGGVEALAGFEPLPLPGVVYSVHMYTPHTFTHQGVHGAPVGVRYPGVIDGKPWDKERLRQMLQPVRDWQRDYGVAMYIGEFSAIRWAPDESACRYLKDCIELFEEYQWDWAYHAFREWNGWSVEHGADKADASPSKTPTSRETLLREGFGKNRR